VRQWNSEKGTCDAVFKFADPVSVVHISPKFNMMFTASWDKMIRVVDLEQNKVTKSFVASKEAIKAMVISDKYIFVAGCDPIIRGFSLEVRLIVNSLQSVDWRLQDVLGTLRVGLLPRDIR